MVRVIEVRRKAFKSEILRDMVHGKEPQTEYVDLITVEDLPQYPTEADLENEASQKEEEGKKEDATEEEEAPEEDEDG